MLRDARLRTCGLWIFVDRAGKVCTIRLDATLQGDVGGVKIGATEPSLVATLASLTARVYAVERHHRLLRQQACIQ